MNLYLLGLLVYMVLITPLRVSLRLRAGRRPGYLFRVQAAGLPFYRRRSDEDSDDETPVRQQELTAQMNLKNYRMLRILLSASMRGRLKKIVHLERLSLYLHISQPDAAQTALLYGGLHAIAAALARQRALPLRIHLKADLQGQGSEALVRCIITLRLGSLFPAALAWYSQMRKAARKTSKEEPYAASH